MLIVRDRINVEGPEWKRIIYKRLRAVVEGFNGRVKSRLAYERLTWQGLGNNGTHVGLVLMVADDICIAAYGIGRPKLGSASPPSLRVGLDGWTRVRGCYGSLEFGESPFCVGPPLLRGRVWGLLRM